MKSSTTMQKFASGWEFSELHDTTLFFQSVALILLPNTILVLEENSMAQDVRAFVADKAVSPQGQIRPGTWWPLSRMHWLIATPEILEGLARLSTHCAEPEVCDHLYAVHDGRLTLAWYDAFSDPLLVSAEVPTDHIVAFGAAVRVPPVSWHVD